MMLAFLSGFQMKILGFALAGAAALGLWMYVAHLRGENERLQGRAVVAERIADENVQALDRFKKFNAIAVAAMTADRDELLARVARLNTVREEIFHAPDTDDGPVAPVLQRTFHSLCIAAGANRDQAGEAGDPCGVAGMPTDAPPPDT